MGWGYERLKLISSTRLRISKILTTWIICLWNLFAYSPKGKLQSCLMYSNFQVEVSSFLQEKQDRRPQVLFCSMWFKWDYQMALVLKPQPAHALSLLLLQPSRPRTWIHMSGLRKEQANVVPSWEGSFSSSLNWSPTWDFPNERSLSAFRWKNCQFNKIYHTGLWGPVGMDMCTHERMHTHVKTNENNPLLLQRKTLEMNSKHRY